MAGDSPSYGRRLRTVLLSLRNGTALKGNGGPKPVAREPGKGAFVSICRLHLVQLSHGAIVSICRLPFVQLSPSAGFIWCNCLHLQALFGAIVSICRLYLVQSSPSAEFILCNRLHLLALFGAIVSIYRRH